MDVLRRSGRLLLWLLAAVGLASCQPMVSGPAAEPEPLPTAAETAAPAPTATMEVVEEGLPAAEVALLEAAAEETAEDVARTARGSATPVVIPAAEEADTLADLLPNLGVAPEINNEVWINSEPLRLEDLRGKVVLVEFWTFG